MIIYTWKEGDSTYSMILPDGSPNYNDLLAENRRLLAENAKLIDQLSKANRVLCDKDLWATLEDVCCSNRPD